VTLACTAAAHGAVVLNHMKCTSLLRVGAAPARRNARARPADGFSACLVVPCTRARLLFFLLSPALLQDGSGQVVGAALEDGLTKQRHKVYARVVINAAGPFSDSIREMAGEGAEPMIMPSAGVHVTLPDYYSPQSLGMIVPKTKDGRVVFMLPWKDATIAGTTGGATSLCGAERRATRCTFPSCL
jgi:glycerol-3-phosphate dehydrogenase